MDSVLLMPAFSAHSTSFFSQTSTIEWLVAWTVNWTLTCDLTTCVFHDMIFAVDWAFKYQESVRQFLSPQHPRISVPSWLASPALRTTLVQQSRCTSGRVEQPSRSTCTDLKCWGAWNTSCWYKADDIASSIALRKEEEEEERERESKRSAIFLTGRERDIHSQTNIGNCFKCSTVRSSERRPGAHMSFLECADTILNWTELCPIPSLI